MLALLEVVASDRSGDGGVFPRLPAAGDASTPSGSSKLLPQGKFWVLADEDSASSSSAEDEVGGSASAFRYLCRPPSADDGRDLI
jgi:hypothetical protein